MADTLSWREMLLVAPLPPRPTPRRHGRLLLAIGMATALHGGVLAVFLPSHKPEARISTMVDAVELSPLPEPVSPDAATASAPAEQVTPVAAEPVKAVAQPTESVPLAHPDQPAPVTPPAPEEVARSEPSQVPLQAETPEPVAEAPLEVAQVPAPPDEVVTAQAPLPVPPKPVTPPRRRPPPPPQRKVAQPAPTSTTTTSQPVASAAQPAAAPAAARSAPVARRFPPNYLGQLLAALERHKEYPTTARRRRAEGTAVLHFTMRRDGSVTSSRIERSSGDEALDAAAVRMVRKASPLPPPPPEIAGETIDLAVPVRFSFQ